MATEKAPKPSDEAVTNANNTAEEGEVTNLDVPDEELEKGVDGTPVNQNNPPLKAVYDPAEREELENNPPETTQNENPGT